MENLIEKIEYKNHQIKIVQDADDISPQENGDDSLFLVHYHHRSFYVKSELFTEDELRSFLNGSTKKEYKQHYDNWKSEYKSLIFHKYHIIPVSAYIHSGVTLSLAKSFALDSGGFDTSHCGFVFAAKSEFKTAKKARAAAAGLISTWNNYLSGEIYGYIAENKDGECVGSCWGFYGDEGKADAILNAKDEIDCEVKSLQKKHLAKLRQYIFNKVNLLYREFVV